MKEVIHRIRKAIIDRLTNEVSLRGNVVPIYGRVPSNASYPFVRVYSLTNNEVDQNQSTFNSEVITRIEVVTRFESDSGGELDANTIMNDIMALLITKNQSAFNLASDNFNCYAVENSGITYIQEDLSDHTYFRAILELSNKVEQTS